MNFDSNPFSLTLILLGLFTLIISIIAFKRLGTAIHSFGYLMMAIATWSIFYGIELGSTDNKLIQILNHVEYLSISSLPALWIIFIIKYTGKDKWLNPGSVAALFTLPFITLILQWTNSYHHLHYATVSYGYTDGLYQLIITQGPWYKVHTVFFYAMLVWGMYLLVKKMRTADEVYRKQNRAILLAAFIPWIANILYISGIDPFENLDITPFAFIITSLVIGFALLKYKLFDIVPIAREKIMEAMQEGVLVLDVQNRIVDANTQMKNILAPFSRKLIGIDFSSLKIGDSKLAEALAKQSNDKIELKLNDSNSDQYFAVTITSIFEKNSTYTGHFLLFRNITERKQSEDNLQALNQLKDRLFSIISHDLRSPLNTLLSIITLTNEGQLTEEELKSFLPEISKNLGYTTGLVNNLLQWSKSQLKGEVMQPLSINFQKKADTVIELFQKSASDKKITISNTIPPHITGYADRDMIQAVLRNLISNAIKFCNYGGHISISGTSDMEQTTICVADDGVGIDATGLNKIFGLETFTTRGTINEQGTGLGLLLCKDFVEKNKGKIWVESTPGQGSKFYFSLPKESNDNK